MIRLRFWVLFLFLNLGACPTLPRKFHCVSSATFHTLLVFVWLISLASELYLGTGETVNLTSVGWTQQLFIETN